MSGAELRKRVEDLNAELKTVSDRYSLRVSGDVVILVDSSFVPAEEEVLTYGGRNEFGYTRIKSFVDGFKRARNTIG